MDTHNSKHRLIFLLPQVSQTVIKLALVAILSLLIFGFTTSLILAQSPIKLNTVADWQSQDFDRTDAIAWGDMDGDGDLDLAVGNESQDDRIQFDHVYLNDGGVLQSTPVWTSPTDDVTTSLAWGDIDRDGDLDLMIGIRDKGPKLYLNEGGMLQQTSVWSLPITLKVNTRSIALGDIDGDGYLDLAVGNTAENKVYANVNGTFEITPTWTSIFTDNTNSVAWGDVDGDGDLDLAVGNQRGENRVYANINGTLETTPIWTRTQPYTTTSVAWGDVNGDGYLDLAVGNHGQQDKIYTNIGGTLQTTVTWTSAFSDNTSSLVWGDVDGDGDLDLVVGNDTGQPNKVYLNDSGILQTTPAWMSDDAVGTRDIALVDVDGDGDLDLTAGNTNQPNKIYLNEGSLVQGDATAYRGIDDAPRGIALGDIDSDGDLDLAVNNGNRGNKIYLNEGGVLQTTTAAWTSTQPHTTSSLAWGDVDGDGDLDLAVGNQIYTNINGALQTIPSWTSTQPYSTTSVAWGDVNGDGYLDLAVGNEGQQNVIYANIGGTLQTTATWTSTESDDTLGIAWGDVDGDGDLDLAVANNKQPNKIYRNQDGRLETTAFWISDESDQSASVAWGDINGDGNLDLVVSNSGQPNRLYLNEGGTLQRIAAWISDDTGQSLSLAVGDVDGDGDLDVVTGDYKLSKKIYLNKFGVLQTTAAWVSGDQNQQTYAVALGDMDGDGDLDLVAGDSAEDPLQTYKVYPNQRHRVEPVDNDFPHVAISHPPDSFANYYASAEILRSPVITLDYTLFDNNSVPVRLVRACYSLDGGDNWQLAVKEGQSVPDPAQVSVPKQGCPFVPDNEQDAAILATSPYPTGTLHTFAWDTFASGFFGQSDNVVFRIEAYPDLRPRPNRTAGPYQWPYASATTFPFRVRGTQVRVVSPEQPDGVANALVYKLPAGQATGGCAIGPGPNGCTSTGRTPFRTDGQGYLQGRGALAKGDRLLALAPLDWTDKLAWAVGLTDTLRLYYTNDTDDKGVPETTISQAGVQTVTVSAANPLALFDLDVSLEWDASQEASYLSQLATDLKRTSDRLYDFTDKQVALGRVTVFQDADAWAFSHVDVHATNRLRPYATIGGLVLTDTADISPSLAITYSIGQVHIGATWNRYGEPTNNPGVDWPLILAHEFGHFLLFQEDTYLGLAQPPGFADEILVAVGSCTGSAMGDVYGPDNTEFIGNTTFWDNNCAQTLAAKELKRDEWRTLQLWYPPLRRPDPPLTGPDQLPFNFTQVDIRDPLTPTNVLPIQDFTIDYVDGDPSSSKARAFLLRNDDTDPTDFEYVYDLGSPIGGQNLLRARGAQPGDRLCIFDQPRQQYGCQLVSGGVDHLQLTQDPSWNPIIQISPVTSVTFKLAVTGVPTNSLNLRAQLYPEFGQAFTETLLSPTTEGYSGTLELAYPSLEGDVRLWADSGQETMVSYSIGGNPGNARSGGGGDVRGGGSGNARSGGGGDVRPGEAPIISPDGQMIFFATRELIFNEGEFYTVQSLSGLPPLPEGKVVIGAGYNLFASPGAPPLTDGSISFQYLGNDVLVEEKREDDLVIHHWNGSRWQALQTYRDTKFNLASTRSVGAGIYALLAGTTMPHIDSVSPASAVNNITNTVTIRGGYFLEPLTVVLVGPTTTYTLPITAISTDTLTVEVAKDLPAREYEVIVRTGNQPSGMVSSPVPGVFALFSPEEACFYDFFESGAGQWERSGEWDIAVIQPSGARAMTDSPSGPYKGAGDYEAGLTSYTSAVTSVPFALDSRCANPDLVFKHDYALAQDGQDVAVVEIWTKDDPTWHELRRYTGLPQTAPQAQDVPSPEWVNAKWQNKTINLNSYAGQQEVRLRFSLTVNDGGSDRGWVIDDVIVKAGEPEPPINSIIYLPVVFKN